jgi:hypothetical protein
MNPGEYSCICPHQLSIYWGGEIFNGAFENISYNVNEKNKTDISNNNNKSN